MTVPVQKRSYEVTVLIYILWAQQLENRGVTKSGISPITTFFASKCNREAEAVSEAEHPTQTLENRNLFKNPL